MLLYTEVIGTLSSKRICKACKNSCIQNVSPCSAATLSAKPTDDSGACQCFKGCQDKPQMRGAHCGAASSAAPPTLVIRALLREQASMSVSCGLAEARSLRELRLHPDTLPGLASRARPGGVRKAVQTCILVSCGLQTPSRRLMSMRSVVPKP